MKKLLSLVLAMLMMASLAACGGDSGSSTGGGGASSGGGSGSSGGSDSGTIKIGYISDLTGATSLWGQAGLDGAMLAVEDVNAAGGVLGRQIEVVGMDGKGEPADSVSALRKLIEDNGIVASIGTNFSSCNIPMASVADEMKVPILGTATSNELVTIDESGNLHPYSFRMCFIDSFLGTAAGTYAATTKGYKTAALLTVAGNTNSEGVGQFTAEAFEANGGTLVANEQCQESDTDFRAQMSNIAGKNPDVLFIIMNDYSKIALAAQQAREMGLTCQFMGHDGWDSGELASAANGALEGSCFLSRIGFNSEAGKAMSERYQEVYPNKGLETEILFGYDGVMWVVDAINRAGSADPVAVRDALEATEVFEGLIGTLVMDPATHNPSMDCAIFECENDAFQFKEVIKASDLVG
ncbi:MAG: ABC transporter substrate-binding protein [Oscillibacter sp.]|jgi:branched-chain amino acid transport system substrate-binding protein|nr:ABC transporter substrate-binding protein [Oscillibacter sp.]